MDIQVGEYVRTRGIIGKLIRIEYDKIDTSLKWYVLDKGNYKITYVNKPYIEKYSPNIIDLLEVGDIIHIGDVLHEDIVCIFTNEYLEQIKNDIKNGLSFKSILTKEQYNSNCYKLEE